MPMRTITFSYSVRRSTNIKLKQFGRFEVELSTNDLDQQLERLRDDCHAKSAKKSPRNHSRKFIVIILKREIRDKRKASKRQTDLGYVRAKIEDVMQRLSIKALLHFGKWGYKYVRSHHCE
jgi:hypothetical protein